jgi:uncharacterized membrane protein
MSLRRIVRHLLVMPGALKRAFPATTMMAIEQAIAAGEREHSGEVRFAAEAALDVPDLFAGQAARERAIDVFSQLRVWDTAQNNGVLIYLLLADHDIEIVADRGINARVRPEEWEAICRQMEAALRRGEFQHAIVAGIEAVSRLLGRHFPSRAGDRNELSDKPAIV